jgi:hypothetical protein
VAKEILSDGEVALLTALVGAVPAIGKWIGGLIDGDDVDPAATRRVSDVLPERSASAEAAAALRAGR